MPVRRRAKVDGNQEEIVQAFRRLSASVAICSGVGDGFTDLVVGFLDCSGYPHSILVEVKNWELPPSKRQLTPDQETFHSEWRGSITVVETVDDVIELVETVRRTGIAPKGGGV